MKREYKIGHYKRANERIIYKEYDWLVQYLAPWMIWTSNKSSAKRFLHEQDAVSNLSVIKFKWDLKTEEEYIDEKINEGKIKTSREEL
jgi:hypothetical protein